MKSWCVLAIKLWRLVPRPVGEKVIGTRWVDTNKGDERSYAVRSRLVGQESKRKGSIVQYFAATPPLYALKFLLSLAVTVLVPYVKVMYTKRSRYIIQFLDVKKAHWWAKAERTLYVELPWGYKKLHNITDDLVGLLRHSMYGMRDAAQLWEKCVAKKMNELGFRQGSSSSVVFWHPIRDIRTSVHGDNFASLGARPDLKWLHTELAKDWKANLEGYFGPPGEPDCVHEIVTLNRLLSWGAEGIEWECDPRHAEILIRELGLTGAQGAVTPGVKEKPAEADEEDIPLPDEQRTWYRSLSQRAAYVAQDRPDLGVATRELAKGMQKPTERHLSDSEARWPVLETAPTASAEVP